VDARIAWPERIDALRASRAVELTNAVRATLSCTALSEDLPRYNRSTRRYALALMETTAP
jgi:hypothetical protein